MSSEELKPCPFCGSAAQVKLPGDSDGFPVHVRCRCGAQLYGGRNHFGSEFDAVSSWNTRAQLATIHDYIEAALAVDGLEE